MQEWYVNMALNDELIIAYKDVGLAKNSAPWLSLAHAAKCSKDFPGKLSQL